MGGRNTREKILELTIAVIDEGGEQAVRTNQLATDAGTTPPTLYHYFGSREGLIEQAQAERFLRSLIDDANYFVDRVAVAETGDELRAVLGEIFSRRDGAERENVRRRRLNAIGAAYARDGLSRRIAEVHNSIVSEVAAVLLPFQQRGIIRQEIDLRAVIAWYNGAVLGKALSTIDGSDIDVAAWERTMNEAILVTLFGSNPAG